MRSAISATSVSSVQKSIFLSEIGVAVCQQCYRATRDYATGVVIFLGFRMSAFEDNFAAESSTHGQDEVRLASFFIWLSSVLA